MNEHSLSQYEEETERWGRSARLWGHRWQDALTVSTMAWSPLLLTLLTLCTGDWMQGQGKGPGKTRPFSLLSFLKPTVTISVSPFQDPVKLWIFFVLRKRLRSQKSCPRPIPGILQARTLEWGAIAFSDGALS